MLRIIFFDDYPNASETQLFRDLMRDKLKDHDLTLDEVRTVPAFEGHVRQRLYDVVILDIMAESSRPLRWTDSEGEVPSTLTGVELLRRCRKGVYGDRYKKVPIYMRTARGEARVRQLCEDQGATKYFRVAVEDLSLIEEVYEVCVGDPTRGGNM